MCSFLHWLALVDLGSSRPNHCPPSPAELLQSTKNPGSCPWLQLANIYCCLSCPAISHWSAALPPPWFEPFLPHPPQWERPLTLLLDNRKSAKSNSIYLPIRLPDPTKDQALSCRHGPKKFSHWNQLRSWTTWIWRISIHPFSISKHPNPHLSRGHTNILVVLVALPHLRLLQAKKTTCLMGLILPSHYHWMHCDKSWSLGPSRSIVKISTRFVSSRPSLAICTIPAAACALQVRRYTIAWGFLVVNIGYGLIESITTDPLSKNVSRILNRILNRKIHHASKHTPQTLKILVKRIMPICDWRVNWHPVWSGWFILIAMLP